MTIKHISFDVWGTLVTSNPEFAKMRTVMISSALNTPVDEVKHAYTKVKRQIDQMAELSQGAVSTNTVYDMLLTELGYHSGFGTSSRDDLIMLLRLKTERLFHHYPPSVDEKTIHQVTALKLRGFTLSISSNSNFISGHTMYPFLQKVFNTAFDFGIFSDIELIAKPQRQFFMKVMEFALPLQSVESGRDGNARTGYIQRQLMYSEILHVGDNAICDGIGPHSLAMPYVIVDSPADIQPAFRHLAFMLKD